jgi:type IV secretion system protein VirB6
VLVVMGLLLALGPVFVLALLFETTRGLFVGWLRVLAGALLGAIAAPAVLALQLAIVEPQVLALRDLLDAGRPVGALPQQILGTAAVFALIMLAALIAVARVPWGFGLPRRVLSDAARLVLPERPLALPAPEWARAEATAGQSRAARIAEAARAIEWREQRAGSMLAAPQRTVEPHPGLAARSDGDLLAPAALPLGQAGRRTLQRQSGRARQRDDLT